MKRALAERAKQSLNAAVSNAKEQRHNLEINHAGVSSSLGSRHLPQQPAEISSPPSTSTNNTTSTNNSSRLNASESVSDSLRNCAMINGSFSSLAPVNRSSPSEFSTHPYTDTTAYSITANTTRIPSVQAEVRTNVCAQTDSSTFERPPKVPRLENTQEVPVVPSRDRSATVGATSVSMTQINPILATTSNENKAIKNRNDDTNVFSPPARLAMEPPSVRSAATSDHQSGKLSKKVDETEDDSAFYLKHQNRALATELKSLQFAVSQLEIERDTRRTHCYEALQAMNKLHLVWTDIIDKTIGESVESTVPVRRLLPRLDTAQDLPSTGTADSVEWTRALQNAILLFGQPSQEKNQSNETDEVETAYACLEQSVSNMSAKALTLQEWFIGSKTSVGSASASLPATQSNEIGNSTVSFDHRFYNVKSEMAVVLARCSELEAQLSEMSDSRKEVVSRERRVRRNIYRLAAGMLSPEQVISSLEEGDEDGELAAAVQLEKQQIKIEHHHQLSNRTDAVEDQADDAGMDSRIRRMDHTTLAHIDELQVRVLNLEQMVESGENAIQELNLLLNKKQQQISELSKRQLSDEDTSKLESLQSTLLQLRTAQNRVTELESKLEKTQEKWSLALGNEKTALGAVDDLISKFNKRWLELSNGSIPLGFGEDPDLNGVSVSTSGDTHQVETTKTIAELQHKLNQALEHIRQSEMARDNLKVAIAMNGTLQAKLDEVKAKYAAIRTSQQHTAEAPVQPSSSSTAAIKSRDNSMASVAASAVSEQKAGTAGHSGRTDREKLEKLDRLYRRARKELASMTLSKDSSKSKFERAEKERDSLMDSNVRLLKQMGEKDEMNAKSLSTILHLKNMTEKLTEERDNLEQQAKSASQLALASRLATNAKERIAEEVSKEKKASEDRLHELEKQYNETQIELERVSAEWSEASGKMAVKESELAYAWKRSDELATENEQKREEIRKLVDVVNNAERESRDAKEKLTNVMKSDLAISTGNDGIGDTSYGTTFTAEQLQTQISVLKNRLACPVCHYRDKECIILRCRHMHCKQCVDERISNRSRKCPTCNVKFSENEVGDIWLS